MSLFKRVHNDSRLRLQRGRTEEVEVTKECDAAGKRSEHIHLLRDWGITNFGQKFPPDSRLADWSRGAGCGSKRTNSK